MRANGVMFSVIGAVALAFSGCGDDDDTSSTGGAERATSEDGTAAAVASAPPASDADPAATTDGGESAPAPGGGGGGQLVLGDETVAFDSARCFLEEQDAAAGGGKILFVAQAFGVNAAGDDVSIDVSRYDEDSQFAGDSISVVIGDPFSPDAVSLDASSELGTVTVDGATVSADGLTFLDSDGMNELAGSFRIDC